MQKKSSVVLLFPIIYYMSGITFTVNLLLLFDCRCSVFCNHSFKKKVMVDENLVFSDSMNSLESCFLQPSTVVTKICDVVTINIHC